MFRSLIIALPLLIAVPITAQGGEHIVATVHYPAQACAEIVSQEYFPGRGPVVIQTLEILCRDAQGRYSGFFTSWTPPLHVLRFGQQPFVSRFDYVPMEQAELTVLIK